MSDVTQILSTIEAAVNRLGGAAAKKQEPLFKELLSMLKRLDTRGDTLLNNIANLKTINEIKVKLERLIISDKYKDELKAFAESYNSIQDLHNAYFASFAAYYRPTVRLNVLKKTAIESTLNGLTEVGIQVGVTEGLRKILRTNISTGGSYAEMTHELRNYMLTNDSGEGALQRYVKTFANTAINQFSAEYNKAIADDLGLEWYMYTGSLLETSREFCQKAVKKKYIHVSEFPTILKGNFGELGKIPLSPKTDLPPGLMAGTNPDNFPRRRGGWSCGHQLIAVSDAIVPSGIKDSVYKTAEYKKWKAKA